MYIFLLVLCGGQDKRAWTACPQGVKITRVGGKISWDSLPHGGMLSRGQDKVGHSLSWGQDKLLHRRCWHFCMKNLTSLNGLKFHMQVSDADFNKYCKFDEIW